MTQEQEAQIDRIRALVDPSGAPLVAARSKACQGCGAGADRRRPSGGFGAVHDVCGVCGHAFEERTI